METILFNIQCDVPNKNGRIYPRAVVEQMVERMNEHKPPMLVHACRPTEGVAIPLEKVVGVVEGAYLTEDDQVAIQYTKLNTPLGPLLDFPHDLISVGMGKVTNGVVSDYKLCSLAAIVKEGENNGN